MPPGIGRPRSPCQQRYDDTQRRGARVLGAEEGTRASLDILERGVAALLPDPGSLPDAVAALIDLRILQAADRALEAGGGGKYRAFKEAVKNATKPIAERVRRRGRGDRDRGRPPAPPPGRYVEKNESMPDFSRRYQEAQGARPGAAYRVDGPDGPVDFDAFEDGVLIEAKGRYDDLFEKPFSKAVEAKLIKQARSQLRVAGDTPIQWRFVERDAAARVARLLGRVNLGRIEVQHVPMS